RTSAAAAAFDGAFARALRSVPAGERPAFLAARDRLMGRLASVHAALDMGNLAPTSPSAPPRGLAAGELIRLRYPLHPGQSWNIREDPLFTATVEGVDALDLAPGRLTGFRTRYTSDLFGPHDRVHL